MMLRKPVFAFFNGTACVTVLEPSAAIKNELVRIEAPFTKIQFVCEECSLPLNLYGENTIQELRGDRVITRKFCDLHAEEFFASEVKKK
jgi:hypothetical protein